MQILLHVLLTPVVYIHLRIKTEPPQFLKLLAPFQILAIIFYKQDLAEL